MVNLFKKYIFRLRQTWGKSIRRQLVWSFSLASLLVILGSGSVLYLYERKVQFQQGTLSALELAHGISVSSRSWVLANDLAGLQEVVQGVAETTDLKLAVVLSPQGEVLASTKREYIGQYFTDTISRRLLGAQEGHQILLDEPNLIDLAVPINAGSQFIGWSRVELTRDTANTNLREIAIAGLGIALFLILMIYLIATRTARSLTRGLDHLVIVANQAEQGVVFKREESERADEIGVLANHLYRMLDTINKEQQERALTENELRRYKDHLEEEVQERTADLVLARNAAEAANKAKSTFLASMSHELRTPLNAILGFSNMMRKDTQLTREQQDNLNIINRSGEHLLTLINDVLEMAKIEAGRVQIETAPFDLGGMVRDVTDMMYVRAHQKGLQLLIDQSSEFPRYIKGDEARLRQVLINLVGNALKFTEQGGVTVRFGMKPDAEHYLLMEVEDSGIGIKQEDLHRVFEPFVQVGQTAAQKGTGLGLTITRQFVQLMGGKISVESTPGKGSTFRVELPVVKVAVADVTQSQIVSPGEVIGLIPGQPDYRILIVEDQLENQLLLSKLMENVGFQVKVAENGVQAISMFQSWHPHLIWMDRRMPVMDGVEATRKIRTLPNGCEVKIVAVTASAFVEQRDEMLAVGMDDFVRKPYRFNEIYDVAAKLLGVKYIYAGIAEVQETQTELLTEERLAVLPEVLRSELYTALQSLESERINAVIQQAKNYDVALFKTLTHLTGNFDYPSILKVLEKFTGNAL